MTFDAELAARIRKRLGPRAGVTEKKMFGGLTVLGFESTGTWRVVGYFVRPA